MASTLERPSPMKALILAWLPVFFLPLAVFGFAGPCEAPRSAFWAILVILISSAALICEVRAVRTLVTPVVVSGTRARIALVVSVIPVLPVALLSGLFFVNAALSGLVMTLYH